MVLLYQLDCNKVLSFIEAGDAALEHETNTNNSEIEPSDYWDNTLRFVHLDTCLETRFMFYAPSKNLIDNRRRNMYLSFVIQSQKFQVQHFIMTFHLEFQVFASMQTRKQSLIVVSKVNTPAPNT